jgi:hypothetical protein
MARIGTIIVTGDGDYTMIVKENKRRSLGLPRSLIAPTILWSMLTILLIGCAAGDTGTSTGKTSALDSLPQLLKTKSSQTSAKATTASAPAVSPAASKQPKPRPTQIAPTNVTAAHFTMNGRDSQTSKPLQLNDGLAIAHVKYTGNADLSVILRDQNQDAVADLAEGNGAFDGSTAFGLSDPCDCVVDVQTTGDWSIVIDQPTTLAGIAIPTSVTGNGQAASNAFQSTGGLTRFHLVLQGHTGGQVTLLTADGEELDLLGEGDVAFERSRTVELDPGTYLLQVDTDGPWTVDVSAASGSQ